MKFNMLLYVATTGGFLQQEHPSQQRGHCAMEQSEVQLGLGLVEAGVGGDKVAGAGDGGCDVCEGLGEERGEG